MEATRFILRCHITNLVLIDTCVVMVWLQVSSCEKFVINTDKMYDLILDKKKWEYGNANLRNVYYDELNRTQLLTIRKADIALA